MIFAPRAAPNLPPDPREAVKLVSAWAASLFRDLSRVLNQGVLPDDQFDALEVEVEFVAVPDAQAIPHPLLRTPVRVETVRSDQAGAVYTTAQSATSVTVETTAIGTYRLRIS